MDGGACYILGGRKQNTVTNYHKTYWSGSNSDSVNESKTSEHRLGRYRERDSGEKSERRKRDGNFLVQDTRTVCFET